MDQQHPGIDPDVPLELRVEFTKTGRDGTLVRIVQGPFEPDVAGSIIRKTTA